MGQICIKQKQQLEAGTEAEKVNKPLQLAVLVAFISHPFLFVVKLDRLIKNKLKSSSALIAEYAFIWVFLLEALLLL